MRKLNTPYYIILTLAIIYLFTFLCLLCISSQAQSNFSFQAVNRNVSTVSTFCQSNTSCNISNTGAGFYTFSWTINNTLSACSIKVDSSADNITWNDGDIIPAQDCTSNGQATSGSSAITVNYIRVDITTITGSGSLNTILTGYENNPSGGGITGDLTSGTYPIAQDAHTLIDGTIIDDGNGGIDVNGGFFCCSNDNTLINFHASDTAAGQPSDAPIQYQPTATATADGQSVAGVYSIYSYNAQVGFNNVTASGWYIDGALFQCFNTGVCPSTVNTITLTDPTIGTTPVTGNFSLNAQTILHTSRGAATSSFNLGSFNEFYKTSYWNGTASQDDFWQVETAPLSGTNPNVDYYITHRAAGASSGAHRVIITPLGNLFNDDSSHLPANVNMEGSAAVASDDSSNFMTFSFRNDNNTIDNMQIVTDPTSTGTARNDFSIRGKASGTLKSALYYDNSGNLWLGGDNAENTTSSTSTEINTSNGTLGHYAGMATAGLGMMPELAVGQFTSRTTAVSTTTLLATSASNASYLITANINCTTTSASATVSLTVSWTDTSSTVQSITTSNATCTTLGSSSFVTMTQPIRAKASTNITWSTTIANTPTYDVDVEIYKRTIN